MTTSPNRDHLTTDTVDQRVVVVGGGAAAAAALGELERLAFRGAVTVVGAEPERPYNRTTVNKGLLSGAATPDSILLPVTAPPQTQWLRGSAAFLDVSRRLVRLLDGRSLPYDGLVLATGSGPGPLPGPLSPHVHGLSTAGDSAALRQVLDAGPAHVVIIGAGLIGTETAGVLTGRGHRVTLVDQEQAPLATRLGVVVDDWVRAQHAAAGVALALGRRVEHVLARDAGGVEVVLDDGSRLAADVVVAALGARPCSGWLQTAGLTVEGAVLTDAELRVRHASGVAIRAVAAAGDVAMVEHPVLVGRPVHSPHWGSALAQGAHAARTVLRDLGVATADDGPRLYDELPSYSTYVHGVKVHVAGVPDRGTSARFVRGDAAASRFALAFLDEDDLVVGAVAVGGARPVTALRPLIAERRGLADLALSA